MFFFLIKLVFGIRLLYIWPGYGNMIKCKSILKTERKTYMSATIFDSRNTVYREPFGAVASGTEIRLTIRLSKTISYESPELWVYRADEWEKPEIYPMEMSHCRSTSNLYTIMYKAENPGLYFYCFHVIENNREIYICKDAGGRGVIMSGRGDLWQLTVYEKDFQTPDFLRGGVIYQIFPDRFYSSGTKKENVPKDRKLVLWGTAPEYLPDENGEVTNSDYAGGDLKGIEEKLPYLESLGVTAIYLNPIFEAHSNHRYNTADYLKIDPLLGTEEDFKSLCAAAKKLGISIFIDGVFSHTGSDSIYFNQKGRYKGKGAYQSKESPYYKWYNFQDYPNGYTSWWGFKTLPEVREEEKSYLEFICGKGGVAEKWLSLGASGYRLDVADELPDVFLDRFRKTVKAANPQALILGEVWEDASNKTSYGARRRYFLGKQLDSVMNYPFKDAILDYVGNGGGDVFYNRIMSILENYPKPVLGILMNSLSTHDTERAITALGGEPSAWHDRNWQAERQELAPHQYASGKAKFLLCSVLQFTMVGTPCIYYGDEIGMMGYKDPFNRFCFDWENRDEDIFRHIKVLGEMRRKYRGLFAEARFLPVSFTDSVCCYLRIKGEDAIFVAINRSLATCPLPRLTEFRETETIMGKVTENHSLMPMGFIILKGKWVPKEV